LFWQYKKQLIEDIAEVTAQSPQSEEEMREIRLTQHAEEVG
jgi:hypothetical protein